MADSQSTDPSSANYGAQITHVQMVNTNLPVPPEGIILPRQDDQSLMGANSASGSVANNPNLHKLGLNLVQTWSKLGLNLV